MAELLKRNLMIQVVELFRRPRTMRKILDFGRDHQLFQHLQGIEFLYDRGRKPFYLLAWEAKYRTGEALSAKLPNGEATGKYFTGAPGEAVFIQPDFFKSSSSCT